MASPPTPPLSSTTASSVSLPPISPSSPPTTAPSSPSLCIPTQSNNKGIKQILPDGQDLNTRIPSTDQPQPPAEPSDKMAPRGSQRGGRPPGPQRREADFSSVLSPSQKAELVALINSTTKFMQDELCSFFDRVDKPLVDVPSNAAANKNINSQDTIVGAKTGSGIRDVTESQGIQGELKKEAVAAYQKWLALINKRVSEISAVKEQPPQPSHSQGRFSNGKQPARGSGRGGAGRSVPMSSRQGGLGGGKGGVCDSKNGPIAQSTTPLLPGGPVVPLLQLTFEKRQLLFHTLLLLVMSLDSYPAYSRILMARLAAQLSLPPRIVTEEETRIAWGLSHAADSVFNEEGVLRKNEDGKRERRPRPSGPPPSNLAPVLENAKIGSIASGSGIGTVAAATVLGTMGTLSDGGLATCIFFGLCGPRGSPAKTLDTFTRDIQDIGLVPLHGSSKLQVRQGNTVAAQDRRLHLTIAISGWTRPEEDVAGPWRVLGDKTEVYALSWEQETAEKVGSSLETVMSSMAWKSAKKEFAKRNILANKKDLTWPSAILKMSKIVDNPWSVGMVRADKVGMALADAIVNKVPGERGVSLLGFGLGARAIYTCLMSLSERRVFGQVENVVMMGTPAPSSKCVWTALRSVVVGRVINVFSEHDHILGFLHRTGCIQFGVAGLERIDDVRGVENVNASKPIDNHLAYPRLVPRILKDVGWEDLDMPETKKAEGKQSKSGGSSRTQEKNTASRHAHTGGGSGRAGRGRSSRRKLEAMEAQFQAMNIVH